jgi:hypothetical protein
VTVAVTNIVGLAPSTCYSNQDYITLQMLKPDGTTLASRTMTQCGGSLGASLSVTGTHTILIDVRYGTSGSLTLTLTSP